MGVYTEYLDRQMNSEELTAERKAQLARIGELRGRDVLVYAADLNKGEAPISIDYPDLLPINDQLANLNGDALDFILETPGGSGEIAEDIVDLLHKKYDDVAVIVPGTAKSAGTLMVMAADEILMEPASSLGPIDAQIQWQGKVFSADALLEGMEAIKKEVDKTGALNKAYIPILQGISPGEVQSAENALKFARKLVTDWLVRFKFKNWKTHSSSGEPVTDEERKKRAEEVAKALCNHRRWLTHGRSIKLDDLEAMRVRITNYAEQADLAEAVRRYHTLLQMSFASTPIYKVIETPTSQIYRFHQQLAAPLPGQGPGALPGQAASAQVDFACGKCGEHSKIQADFQPGVPTAPDAIPFPADNRLTCPKCGAENDVGDVRQQLEAQVGRPVVTQEER